jgi:hypothetical protein
MVHQEKLDLKGAGRWAQSTLQNDEGEPEMGNIKRLTIQ